MSTEAPHRAITAKLLLGVVVMFAFAVWVMPPLYKLFCEITGIGLQDAQRYEVTDAGIDESRTVKVQFLASNAATMPWEFDPATFEIEVHPGEATTISYRAHNTTRKDMVGQAVPHISPANAVDYFHKTECFCFNQQPLAAGEEADLQLVFIVDRDLPKAVNTITLSYTLFDVSNRQVQSNQASNMQ